MKIYIANQSKQSLGGGWSFIDSFKKGFEIVDNVHDCDIFFIPSPTMTQRDAVWEAKALKKKVVLRIDNAVRDSRNRNTGMSRMFDFAEMADLVIYQSNWAKDYLANFLQYPNSTVIINGTDTDIFNPRGRHETDETVYLYSRYNRDETKNWEMARYWYSQKQMRKDKTKLLIVGQFSPDLHAANFDFYQGERIQFLGVQESKQALADIYRQSDFLIYPYFCDACSNTLIEALCCGTAVQDIYGMTGTGGAPDILFKFQDEGMDYFKLERVNGEYREAFEAL